MGRPPINLTGQRFGHLVALRLHESVPSGARWLCVCDCGREKVVGADKLRHSLAPTRSCGCLRAKALDLAGQTFGKLKAIELVIRRAHRHKSAYWRCQCQCGQEVVVATSNLRKGNTTSCGCSRILANNLGARGQVFRHYQQAARRRKVPFTLTFQDVDTLTSQPCVYCGTMLGNALRDKRRHRDPFRYNGLDRKDNKGGYTLDNVVSCCRECNFAKGTRSYPEFLAWLARVAAHLGL